MGCELGEEPNWLEPHGERAFLLSPRCHALSSPNLWFSPFPTSIVSSCPFRSLWPNRQVEKLRQADIWTKNSILGCRFFGT